jgi:membrane protease YdiL (CAAX protease family)
MSIDPETLSPLAAGLAPEPPVSARSRRVIPNLAHTLLFCAMVLVSGLMIGLVFTGLLQQLPLFRHESITALQTDPRAVIPLEVAVYAFAGLLAWAVFPRLWRLPLLEALRWNPAALRRGWVVLAGVGAGVSVAVQLLSNYLPIPKSLPIDQFFTNRTGVWIVAIFGVTVAPFFEELAFRGFLLPSLASAWDWIAGRSRMESRELRPDFDGLEAVVLATPEETASFRVEDPRWSTPALIFATTVTSIFFALLHAGQLAHAWAPLAVLFAVSVVLCLVRLRAHSLAASAFVHACYNGTIFLLLFIGTSGFRHLDKLGG